MIFLIFYLLHWETWQPISSHMGVLFRIWITWLPLVYHSFLHYSHISSGQLKYISVRSPSLQILMWSGPGHQCVWKYPSGDSNVYTARGRSPELGWSYKNVVVILSMVPKVTCTSESPWNLPKIPKPIPRPYTNPADVQHWGQNLRIIFWKLPRLVQCADRFGHYWIMLFSSLNSLVGSWVPLLWG